jgi:hypothetical protein
MVTSETSNIDLCPSRIKQIPAGWGQKECQGKMVGNN